MKGGEGSEGAGGGVVMAGAGGTASQRTSLQAEAVPVGTLPPVPGDTHRPPPPPGRRSRPVEAASVGKAEPAAGCDPADSLVTRAEARTALALPAARAPGSHTASDI